MEIIAGAAIGGIDLWFVVSAAVRGALGEGERADAHERVVHLGVRHRPTLLPLGAEIRTAVPVRIPIAGTARRTFA